MMGRKGCKRNALSGFLSITMEKGEVVFFQQFYKRRIVLIGIGLIAVFMKHKIISWNVRGLNVRDKRLRISNLFRLWKVDIVCF